MVPAAPPTMLTVGGRSPHDDRHRCNRINARGKKHLHQTLPAAWAGPTQRRPPHHVARLSRRTIQFTVRSLSAAGQPRRGAPYYYILLCHLPTNATRNARGAGTEGDAAMGHQPLEAGGEASSTCAPALSGLFPKCSITAIQRLEPRTRSDACYPTGGRLRVERSHKLHNPTQQ